jgi:hypothetical protein
MPRSRGGDRASVVGELPEMPQGIIAGGRSRNPDELERLGAARARRRHGPARNSATWSASEARLVCPHCHAHFNNPSGWRSWARAAGSSRSRSWTGTASFRASAAPADHGFRYPRLHGAVCGLGRACGRICAGEDHRRQHRRRDQPERGRREIVGRNIRGRAARSRSRTGASSSSASRPLSAQDGIRSASISSPRSSTSRAIVSRSASSAGSATSKAFSSTRSRSRNGRTGTMSTRPTACAIGT